LYFFNKFQIVILFSFQIIEIARVAIAAAEATILTAPSKEMSGLAAAGPLCGLSISYPVSTYSTTFILKTLEFAPDHFGISVIAMYEVEQVASSRFPSLTPGPLKTSLPSASISLVGDVTVSLVPNAPKPLCPWRCVAVPSPVGIL